MKKELIEKNNEIMNLRLKLERQNDLLKKKDEMISTLMESLRILHIRFNDESERADYYKGRCLLMEKNEGV